MPRLYLHCKFQSQIKQKDISYDGKEPHPNEKEPSSLSDDSNGRIEFSYFAKMYRNICEIFDSKNIIACYNVAFTEREGGIRHIIVIVIFLFSMNMLGGIGLGIVNYPYAREKFDWESTDYFVNWWSIYSSVQVKLNLYEQKMENVLNFEVHNRSEC